MQFAKDSFYMTLRDRLSALDPQLTVVLSGSTRPAIVVAENELVIPVAPLPDAFYLEWGEVQAVQGQEGSRTLMRMGCEVSYHTFGSSESGVDRGRALAALDVALLSVCQPQHTAKRDYTQTPSVGLGTNLFWTEPVLGEVKGSEGPAKLPLQTQGVRLERRVKIDIFFYPEVNVL
jgi:hypothetical protein